MHGETGEPFADLADLLWRQRGVLDRLLFKLAVVQMILDGRAYAWLPMAADETAGLEEEVADLDRAWRTLVRRESWPPDLFVTIGLMAAIGPAPWDEILGDHLEVLVRLRTEVRALVETIEAGLDDLDLSQLSQVSWPNGDAELAQQVVLVARDGLLEALQTSDLRGADHRG